MAEKSKKAAEERFNLLHNLLTEAHIRALESGEYSSADLKAAADWLHKNDISGVAMEGSPLDNLRHLVPVISPEDVQRRVNGS
jgi:hypothetical protein